MAAMANRNKITMLIIDPQNDFHAGGSLAVSGADDDAQRYSKFIRDNLDAIEDIYISLDSHHKNHLAHASFWSSKEDGTGEQPAPFTLISADEVNKSWFPIDPSLQEYVADYTKKLEAKGHYKLTIWPEHCIIGTPGQLVVKSVQDACDTWSRHHKGKEVKLVHKGMNEITEMYSAIAAEVPDPADPSTDTNFNFINDLKTATGKIVVCGQAQSHCVNYTTRDLVAHWAPRSPADVVILSDGASPVYGCEEQAQLFLSDMKEAGCVVCSCADAITLI